MTTYFHRTCVDHGLAGLGRRGRLRPNASPLTPRLGAVVWLTDNPTAERWSLGLTSTYLGCDRMRVLYSVEAGEEVETYASVRHLVPLRLRGEFERYGDTAAWFVSRVPLVADLVSVTHELPRIRRETAP